VPLDRVAAPFFDRYVVSARAKLSDGRELRLASVHAPASAVKAEAIEGLDSNAIRRSSVKEVWYNDLVYWVLRQEMNDSSFIVSGDWNTARLFDQFPKTYGYGGQSTEFFDRAAAHGWFECLRKFHADEQRTYFKPRQGPYELDHAFCSEDIAPAITSCYVDTRPTQDLELSDHAPVVMELDLSRAGSERVRLTTGRSTDNPPSA
jgi:exonuclease III